MTTITASELKQNSMRLQDALRDDLLVTKRDKPFVVVMDYEKYVQLQKYIDTMDKKAWVKNEYPSITFDEASDRVADAVHRYRSGTMETVSMDEMRKNIQAKRDRQG